MCTRSLKCRYKGSRKAFYHHGNKISHVGTFQHSEPGPDVRLQQTIMHHSCSHVLDRKVGLDGLILSCSCWGSACLLMERIHSVVINSALYTTQLLLFLQEDSPQSLFVLTSLILSAFCILCKRILTVSPICLH